MAIKLCTDCHHSTISQSWPSSDVRAYSCSCHLKYPDSCVLDGQFVLCIEARADKELCGCAGENWEKN